MTGDRLHAIWLVLAAAATLLTVTAGPAAGHAAIRSTSPGDGETVGRDLDEVTMTFNEPVSVPPGGIRVFDEDGERVDEGTPVSRSPEQVGVAVDDLGVGNHIVTWRVVSADGHPIKGAFVFTVDSASGDLDEDLVARLFAAGDSPVIGVLASAARAAGYAGTLLAAGAALYALAVARADARERARAVRWARRGAIVGIAAAALVVPLQAMAVTGLGPVDALAPAILADILGSSVGIGVTVRLVALLAALLAIRRGHAVGAVLAGVLAVLSFLVDGHTRTVEPAWLMLTGDAVHLLAAAAWFGGLVVLVNMLRERTLDEDPVAGAGLVAGYSGVATIAVVAVTIAGLALSWALVRQPRALFSTAYGWTLLLKTTLAAVIIAIGAWNNRRLVPAIARATTPVGSGGDRPDEVDDPPSAVPAPVAGWARLRRTVRYEAAAMIVVLLVTGFLVNLRPAAEEAGITGVFETYVPVTDELELNLVVDPNRAGLNAIHVYLLDRTGRPVGDVEEVTFRLTLPSKDIGPIEREPFVAGPGHWQLNGSELSIAGEWLIDVVVRPDRFTERTASVPVVVNPS